VLPEYSVLVVDDDPWILQSVSEILTDAGYKVEAAQSALEAARQVAHEPAAVVLLDIRLPGLDGKQFAMDLRARHIDSKILVMSAAHNAKELAVEMGADGVLEKPFELNDLLAEVARLCPATG
jgi:DNA-binding response OmpR family regulator